MQKPTANNIRFSFRFSPTEIQHLKEYCEKHGCTQGAILRRGWRAVRDGEVNLSPRNDFGYKNEKKT